MLDYTIEERGSAWLIRFEGDISGQDDQHLRDLFTQLVEGERVQAVADMSRVSFVDSTILGTLVWGMKSLREAGGDFRMYGLHDFVKRLFDITQLSQAFRTFESEDDAVASFA